MCAKLSVIGSMASLTEVETMSFQLAAPEVLTAICHRLVPDQGLDVLIAALQEEMPELRFQHVLTRGGWHRFGGLVDREQKRVAGSLPRWVEEDAGEDVEALVAAYADAGYCVTQLAGKTHFFTAPRSEAADDFVQIEIEELQERLHRPLVAPDWYPDNLEEFLDPLDFPRMEPKPLAPAYYQFRRITSVADLVRTSRANRQIDSLRRFFRDWGDSSASDYAAFCQHWVLALREYVDQEGLRQLTAKPVFSFGEDLPELPVGRRIRGAELANAIHGYDRRLGYPFAWYFMMLGQKAGNYTLADAVLADQMGAYDYLPAKDLKVLRYWEQSPYGV